MYYIFLTLIYQYGKRMSYGCSLTGTFSWIMYSRNVLACVLNSNFPLSFYHIWFTLSMYGCSLTGITYSLQRRRWRFRFKFSFLKFGEHRQSTDVL